MVKEYNRTGNGGRRRWRRRRWRRRQAFIRFLCSCPHRNQLLFYYAAPSCSNEGKWRITSRVTINSNTLLLLLLLDSSVARFFHRQILAMIPDMIPVLRCQLSNNRHWAGDWLKSTNSAAIVWFNWIPSARSSSRNKSINLFIYLFQKKKKKRRRSRWNRHKSACVQNSPGHPIENSNIPIRERKKGRKNERKKERKKERKREGEMSMAIEIDSNQLEGINHSEQNRSD